MLSCCSTLTPETKVVGWTSQIRKWSDTGSSETSNQPASTQEAGSQHETSNQRRSTQEAGSKQPASTQDAGSQHETSNQWGSTQEAGSQHETSNRRGSTQEPGSQHVALPETLPRFGHLYGRDHEEMMELKRRAWRHIVDKTINQRNEVQDHRMAENDIEEDYTIALQGDLEEARKQYEPAPSLSNAEFSDRLIEDGCLFLQLALLILDYAHELDYPPNDAVFSPTASRNCRNWIIEAMFFVGNQIPLVVLKKLLNQQFFKGIKVLNPTSPTLCQKALYDLVFSPRQESKGRLPSDILHGLQIMLTNGLTYYTKEGTDSQAPFCLCTRVNDESIWDDDGDEPDICAAGLALQKISINKLAGRKGIRNIQFRTCCNFWAAELDLPVFRVDNTTEVILKKLILYEKLHRYSQPSPVSSYIKFMSKIVRTSKDAYFLHRRKIIVGNSLDVNELPGILNRLASEGDWKPISKTLQKVIREIGVHCTARVMTLRVLKSVYALTLVQTIFGVLGTIFGVVGTIFTILQYCSKD